jgi:hypothetical protein
VTDPIGTDGNISVSPDYTDTSSYNATEWDLRLLPYSELIDAGDPSIEDFDCTPSDIGPFGGPGGDDNGWPYRDTSGEGS